jgi:hypothetical protein
MSQRHFGRPLVGDPPAHVLRTVAVAFLIVPAGLLLARTLDPGGSDSFTPGWIAAMLGVQAAVTVVMGGVEAWSLWRAMRRAEPVSTVAPPAGAEPPEPERSLSSTGIVAFAFVVGAGLTLGDAAHYFVGAAALMLGEYVGSLVARAIAYGRQRRLGRRYYKTIGEPEKVVWLGASGLE